MKAKFGIAIATGALAVACAGTALAQESELTPSYMRSPVRAPRNALEIGVNTGYTQGFGDIASGERVGNTADAGLGVGMNIEYRATPAFGIGGNVQYQEFNPDNRLGTGTNVRGLQTGVQATFHMAPFQRIDPHVSIGSGYRMLWTVPEGDGNNVLTHGFQLAKLNAGLDIRMNDSVAIGPMIGADLNMFVWRNLEGPAGDDQLDDMSVNTFIYAGLQGRFDVGGSRSAQIQEISRR